MEKHLLKHVIKVIAIARYPNGPSITANAIRQQRLFHFDKMIEYCEGNSSLRFVPFLAILVIER